ncbi:MAG: hypothetical protein LUD50_07650, partial [Clostridia bacterium]|nr:hypothetical protein [Clostridia bacterium]
FEGQDNSYYAVACDLSNYTDFAETFTAGSSYTFGAGNGYYEPTLQERVLFYIVGIDDEDTTVPEDLPEQFQHYWSMLNNSAYQGGGNGTSTKYLEEHEITFPSQRLSGNTTNNELVMLSKDAKAYGIPGQSGDETLKVEFASGEANGLTIATGTSTLSGTDRVIQFYKGTSGSGTQWSVDDGSTATILVTKEVGGKTYNIARYKLTFKKESIALTEAQVAALDEQQSGTSTWDSMWWNDLGERGATYLGNCDLVASLDFDYSNSGYGDSNKNSRALYGEGHGERFNYPFPMDWSSSSVAFYDGSLDVNPLSNSTETATGSYTYHTGSMLWNTYGIVNYYVGNLENKGSITPWEPQYKNVKTHTGNWLYVNPTDKPSTIAELPFDKTDLAEGTEIFVTAWMRNANASRNNPDASVVLALMGVKSDGTEVPVYSVNSGQIESTNGSVALSSESGLDASITGKGTGTNEWYQVFFSYTIKGGSTDLDQYDHFAIKVTNSSLSNQGGYYFDELKVYKKDPTFDVRITPIEEVLSNTYTPMRVDIDYGTMMTCFGLNPNDYTESSTDKQSLDFILINKDKYDASVNGGATAVNALKSSIVDLSYVRKTATLATASTMNRVASSATTTDPTTTVTTKNPGVEFYCYLGKNDEYDSSEAGYNYALDGLLFKNSTDLSADFNADVSAGSTYMIIVHLSTSSDDSSVNAETITDDKLSIFASLIGTQYTNTTTFATGTTVETTTRSGYNLTYNNQSIKDVSIKHKAARWYQENIRGQQEFEDSFDDDNPMETLANGVELQSAHIYVDTIYLTKGTSIDIEVPNKFTAYGYLQLSMNNYYRWFNYENDKNFYVGEEFQKRDGSQIYDLLTKYSDSYKAWAFDNGYVSGWLNSYTNNTAGADYTLGKITFYYPTDNEFNTYIKSRNLENFEGMDNSYYALACDMSNYTDFYYTDENTTTYVPSTNTSVRTLPTFGDNSTYYEPTLEIRALFYIVGVDSASTTMSSGLPEQFQHYWSMLKEPAYQGGTNNGNEKYLEEYEINMPSQRISQNYNNDEVLALSKEARSYAIPGETGEETLDVAFASGEDNGLAILSSTRSLSGDVRVIQFYKYDSAYASDDSNSGTYQWSVDDGSTATVLVTKTVNGTTYNIARFKLTFKYESIPLTEAQVAALDERDELGETTWNKMWWNDMTYRSPSYLENNCTLITSLDFDYGGYGDSDLNSMTVFNNAAGNSSSAHGERFAYPFPLKWNNCSYAFYDGSFDYNPIGTAKVTPLGNYTFNSGHTSWGAYAIVNYYVGNGEMNNYINYWEPTCQKVKNHSGNWLYLDASDLPGTIAELSFDNDLCKGAEIMVTAWMRNSNAPSMLNDPAVMFTVMGVEVDDEGNETHVPIYRHYSGMIVNTGGWVYINDDEATLPASVTGKGTGTNEWFQEYFTFKINDDDTHDFAYYTVKIDNCCAATQGGDFYIDEIKVYVKNSEANVEQLAPTCSGSDTPIRVDLDYDGVMGYLQLNTDNYTSSSTDFINADFIIIDKYKYDEYINEHGTGNDAKISAIKNSIVDVTYEDNGKTITTPDPGMTFYCYYDKNEKYDESTAGSNYPKNDMLLRRTDDVSGYPDLSADFRVGLSTYTPYLLIFHVTDPNTVDNDENGSSISDDKLLIFANYVETQCAIEYEFYVTSNTVIRINGELVDPTVTLCADQAFNIVPTMTYTDDDGETVAIENEYYDWFIGTEDEYLTAPSGYQVSLYQALKDFRAVYETASEFSESATPVKGAFTQNDYNVINYWISEGVLLLYRQTYNMTATKDGITMVLQPIEQSSYSDVACFEYVTLAILTSGTAPSVNLGFSNVNYPSDDFIPSVRVGLSQIEAAASANKPITVNLRGADYESTIEEEGDDGEEIDITIDHLGLVSENTSNDYTKLYLIWTDDAAYSKYFEPDYDLSQFDLPIGQITRLYANKDATKNDSESGAPTSNGSGIGSYMQIYFYNSDDDGQTKFEPKEGCTYT